MITAITDIQSKYWSMSLQGPGLVVTDLEDIKQCLYIILGTRKRTVPYRPTFGNGALDWLDEPLSEALPKMIRDVKTAIQTWEPRIVLKEVKGRFGGADGSGAVEIYWSPIAGTKPGSTVSTIFSIEAGNVYLVDEFNRYILTPYGFLIL